MRPATALGLATAISALTACGQSSGVDASRVELATAEHGVELTAEELEGQPVFELHADGTLVIDGLALSVEEQREKGAVDNRLARIAAAAPKSSRHLEIPDLLYPDVDPAVLVDVNAPCDGVMDLCRNMSRPGIQYREVRFAIRGDGGELRWLELELPDRLALYNYGHYRREVRSLALGKLHRATLWWRADDPAGDGRPPPPPYASLDGIDDLRQLIRTEPLSGISVQFSPDAQWRDVVPVLDAIVGEGCAFDLAEVGDQP